MEFIVSNRCGTLYIVATPIGNLEDISARALDVLKKVAVVAAEDTRHSKQLLTHFGISAHFLSYHDFNERESEKGLIDLLRAGKDVALISDAGTPLINDPGYRVVKAAHDGGIQVVPIPGACALVCALSAAGLPTDKFVFEGYPPDRHAARIRYLESLRSETRTLVFYETPHRISGFIDDAVSTLGPERPATIARELTKKFESIQTGTLEELSKLIQLDKIPQKGEFVVLIHGAAGNQDKAEVESERVLGLLLEQLPLKQAATLTSRITGINRNKLYELGLVMQAKK
jgi:16S rRNA (cytidine1402-2'-O)-methyltransferase